jgi:hypothetical protein
MIRLAITIIAIALAACAFAKDHAWESGKVLDQKVASHYAGQTSGQPNGYPINIETETVVIADDTYTYTAQIQTQGALTYDLRLP